MFYRFTLTFLALNVIRNTANNKTWANKNFNFGKKPSSGESIRYPAFSWKTDVTTGLLEGLSSFIGYALMLAVGSFFFLVLQGI
jgi:hypothetical protein